MAGMIIVAMGGAYVGLLGIKAAGIQSQSTKAYYAAESGMEKFLFELYQDGYEYGEVDQDLSIMNADFGVGNHYDVYFTDYPPLTFQSVGEYLKTKRSVEVKIVK
mgnify:FL=1